jgi:glycosyltransferase involved in cell wall biosynthesis
LYKTIEGFYKFYNTYKDEFFISYTFVGDGTHDEIGLLKDSVEKLELNNVVNMVGRVPFDELGSYFKNHNIGVSFVPMTDYFDAQPVTKTFDYLLSGLPVIATATFENKRIINNTNGVLIKDSPEGFFDGLEDILEMRKQYSSEKIRSSVSSYQWDRIVNELGGYLERLIKI